MSCKGQRVRALVDSEDEEWEEELVGSGGGAGGEVGGGGWRSTVQRNMALLFRENELFVCKSKLRGDEGRTLLFPTWYTRQITICHPGHPSTRQLYTKGGMAAWLLLPETETQTLGVHYI